MFTLIASPHTIDLACRNDIGGMSWKHVSQSRYSKSARLSGYLSQHAHIRGNIDRSATLLNCWTFVNHAFIPCSYRKQLIINNYLLNTILYLLSQLRISQTITYSRIKNRSSSVLPAWMYRFSVIRFVFFQLCILFSYFSSSVWPRSLLFPL